MKKVAVITRTKDRNVMLSRAMESIGGQTFGDFTWVVVNDGGDPAGVDKILSEWKRKDIPVIVVHHEVNKGMEAASNAGIAACSSDYLVIHDDDDTWAENFLEKTVEFLESPEGTKFEAVLTETVRVDEIMEGETIRVISRSRWSPNTVGYPVGCVQFSDIVVENQFAPIALLFRRRVYDKVGGFDPTLPVLGDWDFNLKLLCQGDIAVLPEALAYYHHRPSVKGSNYGNSVHAGVNKHVVYDAVVRNRIIRAAIADGNSTLAMLVSSGRNRLALSGAWHRPWLSSRIKAKIKAILKRLIA